MTQLEERHEEIVEARTHRSAEHLRRLYKGAGSYKEAGQWIGVSGSAVRQWIEADKVPLTADLAAIQIISDMMPAEPPSTIYTCIVPDNLTPAFDAIASGMGLTYTKVSL